MSVPKCPNENGNTDVILVKKDSSAKHWFYTYNNYPENYDIEMSQNPLVLKYVIGKEIGTSGTLHLQGYIEFKKRIRLSALKKAFNIGIHWEKTRNIKQSIEYCKKENNYITNIQTERPVVFKCTFNKDWQIYLLNMITNDPDDRKIYWFWEERGGVGKTTFCKYLMIHHNAHLIPSKSNDAYHAIAKLKESGTPINLLLFDVPRINKGILNYAVIESIKNGLVVSGKYEGGEFVFACPHVIIFANFEPNTELLSADRWVIMNIEDQPGASLTQGLAPARPCLVQD